jgi:hypothetical protein
MAVAYVAVTQHIQLLLHTVRLLLLLLLCAFCCCCCINGW